MKGFGLAQIKSEGYTSQYDGEMTWKHHHDKMQTRLVGTRWYEKPIRKMLRRVYTKGWDDALRANATDRNDV